MKTCLKQLRTEKGFTQSDIANQINISTRQYQRIENNESKPSYDVILKLQHYSMKVLINCSTHFKYTFLNYITEKRRIQDGK